MWKVKVKVGGSGCGTLLSASRVARGTPVIPAHWGKNGICLEGGICFEGFDPCIGYTVHRRDNVMSHSYRLFQCKGRRHAPPVTGGISSKTNSRFWSHRRVCSLEQVFHTHRSSHSVGIALAELVKDWPVLRAFPCMRRSTPSSDTFPIMS